MVESASLPPLSYTAKATTNVGIWNKKIGVVYDFIFVILDLGIWIIGLNFFDLGI